MMDSLCRKLKLADSFIPCVQAPVFCFKYHKNSKYWNGWIDGWMTCDFTSNSISVISG